MADLNLDVQLREIAARDGRYTEQAYHFVFDSLDFILIHLGKRCNPLGNRHINVKPLLVGFKEFALFQFGPLSRIVLESWGIFRTEDIGEVVFALVEGGLLNKQESDHKEDFANGFDFREAFEEEYEPEILW